MQEVSRTQRPAVWPVIVAFGVTLILVWVMSVALVLSVGAARAGGQVSRIKAEALSFALSASGVMAGASVTAGTLLVVSFSAARLTGGRDVVARLRLGRSRASALGIAAGIFGMMGLSLASGTASQLARDLLHLEEEGVMEQIAHALSLLAPSRLVLAVLAIAVAPGLAEETFFRGLLQPPLVARWGRWPGIAATAFAFGLLHLDPVQGSVAFVSGFYLGWLAERLSGIRPSIAAHATNNALFVALAPFGMGAAAPSRTRELALIGGGLAALAIAIAVLRSPAAVRDE